MLRTRLYSPVETDLRGPCRGLVCTECLPQPWLSLDLHDCTLTKNGNDTGTVFRPVGSRGRRLVGSLPVPVFDRSIVGEYQCHCFDHDGKLHSSRTVTIQRKYSEANGLILGMLFS